MRTLSSSVLAALFLTACGGAPPPPPETAAAPPATADATNPKATAATAATAADDPAAKAAGVESLTAGEAKSGTCDEGHKAALEKLLGDVETAMKSKNGEDGKPLGLQVQRGIEKAAPQGAHRRDVCDTRRHRVPERIHHGRE